MFTNPGFMPHIHCYLGTPSLVWTMVTTDTLIGFSYLAISCTLLQILRRTNVPFSPVVVCFGIFIAACGMTHFLEVWTLWQPDYWASAMVKIVTAIASVGTSLYLLRLRNPLIELAEAKRISEERRLQLVELNRDLEQRVEERTKRLERSELHYRTLTEALPQLVWTCLPDGRCDYLSQQWLEYTGVGTDDQLGLGWLASVIHPEDQARTLEHWMGAVEGKHPYDIEYRIRSRKGEYRWFKTRGTPIRADDGRIVHWFGTCTDIQEMRETRKKLEEAVTARDEFLSIVSHELRTPLTSLKLQTQLASRSIKSEQGNLYSPENVNRMVHQTEKQVNQLTRLVDDILDVARIRSGKLVLTRAPVDIREIIFEVADRLKDFFLSSESGPPDLSACHPAVVIGDRGRLDQVITNLLTNAVKYGAGKPIAVASGQTDETATFSVRDHGVGIAEAMQERIFDRFERAVDFNEVSGLGLGLFICKQIVSAHGGEIRVESEPKGGSRFVVEISRGDSLLIAEGKE